jgi:prophage DNA circulation protein
MADSQDIDTALLTKLSSDATLLALMPDNVWMDEAPPGSKRFVVVSLVDENDEQRFGARAAEDARYLVKAVALSTAPNAAANVKSAAARIDVLLDNQPLTATGYASMLTERETRIRVTEVDDVDPTVRWYHRGGQYHVVMST